MKLNAGKRILMFFHWLMSLLICAAFAAYLIKPEFVKDLFGKVTGGLNSTQIMIIGIALLAIYVLLAVVQACIIFHRRKRADRGFITVDSSDTGRVRIAISAIEQMVRQSVYNIDGISDMKIGIENADDAININIIATIVNGSHVPTITMNMQRAIRQFVEMNCGVAVRSVSISINNGASAGEGQKHRRGRKAEQAAPAPMPAYEPPVQTAAPAYEPAAEPVAPAYEPPVQPAAYEPVHETERVEAPVEVAGSDAVAEDSPRNRPIHLTLDPTPGYDGPSFGAQPSGEAEAAFGYDSGEAFDGVSNGDSMDYREGGVPAFGYDAVPGEGSESEMPDPEAEID